MNDTELEEKIKEMKEKAIFQLSPNLNENAYSERIKSINSLLKDDLSRRLIKAGKFDSVSNLEMFLMTQGSPKGHVFDYPALLDGDEFVIPKLDNSNFESNLYFDKYRDTYGLLCQREANAENKILVYVSSFYWSVTDFEGNCQKGKIIGEGMQNISKIVKEAKPQWNENLTKKDYIEFKTRKLCELVGGRRFKVSMNRVYHDNSQKELTSTVIYKYYLVE